MCSRTAESAFGCTEWGVVDTEGGGGHDKLTGAVAYKPAVTRSAAIMSDYQLPAH